MAEHCDTTDVSPILSIAFRRDIPDEDDSLQQRPTDYDARSASETLQ